MVERTPDKGEVVGSIPTTPTTSLKLRSASTDKNGLALRSLGGEGPVAQYG